MRRGEAMFSVVPMGAGVWKQDGSNALDLLMSAVRAVPFIHLLSQAAPLSVFGKGVGSEFRD